MLVSYRDHHVDVAQENFHEVGECMNDSHLLKMFKLPADVGISLMLEDIKDVSL
jgi:hypothetical protein